MKPQIKLKWFLTFVVLALGILMVAGFSMLAANYFLLGSDNMIGSNMERAATVFAETREQDRNLLSSYFKDFPATRDWHQQPTEIQRIFQQPPAQSGMLEKREVDDPKIARRGVYFVIRQESAGQTIFVSHHMSPQTVSAIVHRNIVDSLSDLLTISVLSILAFIGIIWLILKRVSRPVSALRHWTLTLTPDTLQENAPDFSYPELNELATLIQTSLSSVQEGLEREHRFLRHTSHELRTPISVIRSNIELMYKLQQSNLDPNDTRLHQVVERIDRASLTMKQLTETLLWLSRDEIDELPKREIKLDELVKGLVEQTQYLLKGKDVLLDVQTEPCTLVVEEAAAQIVLGNLVRNAFQHSWEGRISIRQKGRRVEVVNDIYYTEENRADQGFGLGLQLTQNLTERLGWPYQNSSSVNQRQASVVISPELAYAGLSGFSSIQER